LTGHEQAEVPIVDEKYLNGTGARRRFGVRTTARYAVASPAAVALETAYVCKGCDD
jgi:hypothetical protein